MQNIVGMTEMGKEITHCSRHMKDKNRGNDKLNKMFNLLVYL